tara:strand:- start:22 stop:255 length:234 start_codon:yes stop_codon:yes gene_type:complete
VNRLSLWKHTRTCNDFLGITLSNTKQSSKEIKKVKNKGNNVKNAPQARQKIGIFGVFFLDLVIIPPLVDDKSETRGE